MAMVPSQGQSLTDPAHPMHFPHRSFTTSAAPLADLASEEAYLKHTQCYRLIPEITLNQRSNELIHELPAQTAPSHLRRAKQTWQLIELILNF